MSDSVERHAIAGHDRDCARAIHNQARNGRTPLNDIQVEHLLAIGFRAGWRARMVSVVGERQPQGPVKAPSRLERFVSKRAADLLVWLARRAHSRGDQHKFRHLRGAVDAGNSAPCDRDGECHLDGGRVP